MYVLRHALPAKSRRAELLRRAHAERSHAAAEHRRVHRARFDERVEYELWTNSNDQCGKKCDTQIEFLKNFKGAAQILEKGGHTQFTPHYITWYCPEAFTLSKQCKSQCINHGRYCAPDPEQDFTKGYDGKDVVVQNLRQACVYRVLNETGKPWVWWDYVTDFAIRCPMKDKKYTKECADEIIKSLGELYCFITLWSFLL